MTIAKTSVSFVFLTLVLSSQMVIAKGSNDWSVSIDRECDNLHITYLTRMYQVTNSPDQKEVFGQVYINGKIVLWRYNLLESLYYTRYLDIDGEMNTVLVTTHEEVGDLLMLVNIVHDGPSIEKLQTCFS